jgi:hypothetical protein
MTTSSKRIRPKGSQESDAIRMHHDSLAPASGWAHSSFGQVLASWVTSGRGWSLLRNSQAHGAGSHDSVPAFGDLGSPGTARHAYWRGMHSYSPVPPSIS